MISNIKIDDYLELMSIDKLQLPKEWSGEDFSTTIENHFKNYIESLELVISKADIIEISEICESILNSIKSYHNGKPSEAYKKFEKFMNSNLGGRKLIDYPSDWEKTFFGRDNDPFLLYRIRNVDKDKPLNLEEIFHVPFSYRSRISTSRYSIPGYPCLYLASELELCVEETKTNDSTKIQIASRFEVERSESIEIIDMGIKPSHFTDYKKYNIDNSQYIFNINTHDIEDREIYMQKYFGYIDLMNEDVVKKYLYWYPLISACSFIRKNRSHPFASEYIIPQMLMQWVREKSSEYNLIAIRYFSSASEEASKKGFNYVFPVTDKRLYRNKNLCHKLSNGFKISKPIRINKNEELNDYQNRLKNIDELFKV